MILVLDEYPLSRQGLESVIRMYRPEEQVLQAGNVKEAVACVEKSQVDMAFEQARELGIEGCVQKDAFLDEILYGLKVVERGGRFYSSGLIESMEEEEQEKKKLGGLTGRELEVLKLLSRGYSNAKIGQKLFISERTVKKHITSILGKLCLENRVEAVLFASRNLPGVLEQEIKEKQL